jgi:hypothetical protein
MRWGAFAVLILLALGFGRTFLVRLQLLLDLRRCAVYEVPDGAALYVREPSASSASSEDYLMCDKREDLQFQAHVALFRPSCWQALSREIGNSGMLDGVGLFFA